MRVRRSPSVGPEWNDDARGCQWKDAEAQNPAGSAVRLEMLGILGSLGEEWCPELDWLPNLFTY